MIRTYTIDAVLQQMMAGHCTPATLAAALGCNTRTIRNRLGEAQMLGIVDESDDGTWSLTETGLERAGK